MATEIGLVDDLLHSPPAPSTTKHRPIVTVDDLKPASLTCWVCQVGADDVESSSEHEIEDGVDKKSKRNNTRSRQRSRESRFVHPCICTLVAHERCLLHWINRKSTLAQPTVRCPQCAHPYRLVAPTSLPLRLFERADSYATRIVWTGVAAVAGTAVGYACYGYGRLTLRAWMGDEAFRKFAEVRGIMLTSDLAVLPVGLLLSRLPGRKLEREVCLFTALWCLPTWLGAANGITSSSASSLVPNSRPLAGNGELESSDADFTSSSSSMGSNLVARCISFVFPPGPATCLHFVTWMARLYRTERDRLRARLFEPLIQRARLISGQELPPSAGASAGLTGARLPRAQRHATHRQRATQIVVLGPGELHHVDTDDQVQPPPLGTEALVDADTGEAAASIALQRPGERPSLPSRVMYVSPASVARLFLTALGTPFAASATGWALQQVALWFKSGNWLERLLAISAFRKPPAAKTLGEAAAHAAAPSTTTAKYQGVPSLHWRNTAGLAVWVVAHDALGIVYRYLRLKRRARMTVEDRPFVGAIVDSLELKDFDGVT